MQLKYSRLPGKFAVCRLPADAPLPSGRYFSITRTEDELSIVCDEQNIPDGAKAETGWVCLKLHGPFAFHQTGVLAAFIDPLAEHAIPSFAISTFDTDYVLIKEEFLDAATQAVGEAGHERSSE